MVHHYCDIVFRVDASEKIGTGHIVRCLTLAGNLLVKPANIIFISRHMPENFKELIVSKGYSFRTLNDNSQSEAIEHSSSYSSWLGVDQTVDAEATLQILRTNHVETLIVDHYALDYCWERLIRPLAKRILVIDDLANRKHECDVLVDQNLYSDMHCRYRDLVSSNCKFLLGPDYAILRDEFALQRENTKPRIGTIKRLLVFLGGVDLSNFTSKILQALSELNTVKLHVDVVIGINHPKKEVVKNYCAMNDFVCHVQTNKMADLMRNADLGIGAGGCASWERCCLGLPSLLVSLADNQVKIAQNLDRLGAAIYLGKAENIKVSDIQEAVIDLLNSKNRVNELSTKAYSLVDGLGAKKICEELVK